MEISLFSLQCKPYFFAKTHLHRHQNRRFLLVLRRHQFRRKLPCFVSLSPVSFNDSNLSKQLQSETLEILEWNRVCQQLSPFTSTSMGFSAVQSGSVAIGRTLEESRTLLAQTTAALCLPKPLDFSSILDVSGTVELARVGQLLTISELCSVKRTLSSTRRLVEQLEDFSSSDGDLSQR